MVSHANVTATLSAAELRFDLRPEDKLVTWLPPYHDFGLIGATLQPVFSGFPAVALSPAAFLQDPGIWLRAISEQRGTLTLGPNFGFELLCEAKLGDTSALDLSQLRAAAQGGEPARAATMRRFAQRFAPFGFRADALRSGYGLAEATLNVAIPRAAGPGQPPLVLLGDRRAAMPSAGEAQAVSNGPAVAGMEVRVVDPVTHQQLADGDTGEIWIAGSAVAQGYWRQPEASEATFRARLANDPAAGPFLRSGDLGTLVDGELFILGRIKELIILRGRNHHPQDIEAAVQACHASLQPESTIAFGVEEGHEERLVVVHGLSRSAMRALDAPALFAAIRRAVIEAHEVDPFAIVLVQPAALPRTTSGKLQRLKAREMYLAGSLAAVASWRADAVDERLDAAANAWRENARAGAGATALPRSETEAMLCALFAQLTGKPEVGLHESFFDIGGDSLGAMTLVAALQRRTGRELPLRELYAHPTPAALAERLAPGRGGARRRDARNPAQPGGPGRAAGADTAGSGHAPHPVLLPRRSRHRRRARGARPAAAGIQDDRHPGARAAAGAPG